MDAGVQSGARGAGIWIAATHTVLKELEARAIDKPVAFFYSG
jgi:hypothetical protein